jgi:hypothetical protein
MVHSSLSNLDYASAGHTGFQAQHNNLTSLAGLIYSSASFVKMTNSGTFALDTNTYSLSSHNHSGTYEPANANIQTHISSTSNPHSTTASQVGLGNVTNNAQWYSGSHPTTLSGYGISDAVSSTGQAYDSARLGGALANTYAPTASPTFTGVVTYSSGTGCPIDIYPTTSTSYVYLKIRNDNTHRFILGQEAAGGGNLITGTTGYASVLGTLDAYPIQFATNGTLAMTILSGGNVLIGQTTGSQKLCVTGNTFITGSGGGIIKLYGDYSGSPYEPGIVVTNHSGTNVFQFNANGGTLSIAGGFTVDNGSSIQQIGATTAQVYHRFVNSGGNYYIGIENSAGSAFGANSYDLLLYSPAGKGICLMTNDGYRRITVASGGDVLIHNNLNAYGEVTAYYSSDRRLKQSINYNWSGLDLIDRMKPANYHWNSLAMSLNSAKDNRLNYGMIADEMASVTPELIHKIYEKYDGVDYIQVIPILVKAIQELREEVKQLKN